MISASALGSSARNAAKARSTCVAAGSGWTAPPFATSSETGASVEVRAPLLPEEKLHAIAALRYGVTRFREDLINTPDSDIRIGRWWDWAIRLVVVQAVVLILWWLLAFGRDDVWGRYGLLNTLAQWGVAIALFLALNRWLVRRTHPEVVRAEAPEGAMPPSIP